MSRRAIAAIVVILALCPQALAKKRPPPVGVIAASVGEIVVVADPGGGWLRQFDAGTVGWLYPAPGGALFAPDLLAGRTTVIDLRGPLVAGRFEGVTMPHFGPESDRYVVVAGEVLTVSYPDRAIMGRIAVGADSPWQVIVVSNTAVLILERRPDGDGGSALLAVDPIGSQLVYRRDLDGDIRHMALSPSLGLLALADATRSVVRLVDPVTLTAVAELPSGGTPADVAFLADGGTLVAAVAGPSAEGSLRLWELKAARGSLAIKKQVDVSLSAAPVRLAAWPGGLRAAVGLASGKIEVVDLDARTIVGSVALPGVPRDVVWCDPALPGPAVPEWSDRSPAELSLGVPAKR